METSQRAAQARLEISTDFCGVMKVEFAVEAQRVVVGVLEEWVEVEVLESGLVAKSEAEVKATRL
jgi:hypothetical protein